MSDILKELSEIEDNIYKNIFEEAINKLVENKEIVLNTDKKNIINYLADQVEEHEFSLQVLKFVTLYDLLPYSISFYGFTSCPLRTSVYVEDFFDNGMTYEAAINKDNFHILKQSMDEIVKLKCHEVNAIYLFICRTTKKKPRIEFYKNINSKIWPLIDIFDAN